MTTKPQNAPLNLPLRLGMKSGHNANLIMDANDETVMQAYGMPLHSTVEEVRSSPRWAEGVARADYMINAANTHPELVDIARRLVTHGLSTSLVADARAILAKIE